MTEEKITSAALTTGPGSDGLDGPALERNAANHTPLSPVSILKRVERVHPELPAQIHGSIRRNWGEVAARCKRLASALGQRGVGKGDTVALIAPIPEECALAIPLLGAVLNANNVRLEASTLGYILGTARRRCCWWTPSSRPWPPKRPPSGRDLLVIDIEDLKAPGGPHR